MNLSTLLSSVKAIPFQAKKGICDARVLFLVGGPRSGTTLLKQVLAGFSSIETIEPESTSIFLLRSKEWSKDRLRNELTKDELDQVYDKSGSSTELFDRFARAKLKGSEAFFLDKLNTVFFHGPKFYADSFKNAKFLFIVRDPRDAVASAKGHYYLKSQSVTKMAKTWNDFVKFQTRLSELVETFPLRYEDLTERPAEMMSKVADYLDVDFSEDLLDPTKYRPSANVSKTEGFWRLQEPIRPTSVGRYVERLTVDEIHIIEKRCTAGMEQWGYPISKV